MATASRVSPALLFVTVLTTLPLRAAPAAPLITDEHVAAFTHTSPAAVAAADLASVDDSGRPRCGLSDARSDQASSQTCLQCHSHSRTHPYDVDYGTAARQAWGSYASPDEVVRAGVLLPDGQIRCVTCHDGRSPWKYKIALPPGSRPSPSVASQRKQGMLGRASAAPLQPGADVTPTPLCRVCHQF